MLHFCNKRLGEAVYCLDGIIPLGSLDEPIQGDALRNPTTKQRLNNVGVYADLPSAGRIHDGLLGQQ